MTTTRRLQRDLKIAQLAVLLLEGSKLAHEMDELQTSKTLFDLSQQYSGRLAEKEPAQPELRAYIVNNRDVYAATSIEHVQQLLDLSLSEGTKIRLAAESELARPIHFENSPEETRTLREIVKGCSTPGYIKLGRMGIAHQ